MRTRLTIRLSFAVYGAGRGRDQPVEAKAALLATLRREWRTPRHSAGNKVSTWKPFERPRDLCASGCWIRRCRHWWPRRRSTGPLQAKNRRRVPACLRCPFWRWVERVPSVTGHVLVWNCANTPCVYLRSMKPECGLSRIVANGVEWESPVPRTKKPGEPVWLARFVVVPQTGLEPVTYCFEGRRSIH